jgi:hypothetical protein
MSSVPSGGPGNINGINYQMLWALSTLGSFKGTTARDLDGSLIGATLILEPAKGGDQQELLGTKRVVVQLKARSDGGTWSLQEVVRDVLPDLYLAVDPDKDVEYHFVTEGTRGEWEEVEKSFASLHHPAPSDPLARLDDRNPLKFLEAREPLRRPKTHLFGTPSRTRSVAFSSESSSRCARADLRSARKTST